MDKQYVTVRLPKQLHKTLRLASVMDDMLLDDTLIEAVEQYLVARQHASISRVRGDSDKYEEGQ